MKQNEQNIITFKIGYECEDSLLDIIKQYNNVLRFTYNRLFEDNTLKTKDITSLQKTLKHCDMIKSYLRSSAIFDAKALIAKDNKKQIIFGGKHLFKQRCKKKIEKDEFQLKKLRPLLSIGEAIQSGNRLFQILDDNTILFKLDKNNHFTLKLKNVGSKRRKEIKQLKKLQDNKSISMTYKLDLDNVYISFDYNKIKEYHYNVIQNRVLAIDMNPNSIGWSVVDWHSEDKYTIVQSGTFSLKALNDYRNTKRVSSESDFHQYITNKRNHEVIEIAKQLFGLTRYYHCEVFAIEELTIKTKDNKKGRRYNRLVNNMWNRNLLVNQIRKRINASSTVLAEILPQYNSYIGNLIFRHEGLPDECLASIEIGRRGYEFCNQYIFKRRQHKKVIVFPDLGLVKERLALSLEELGIDVHDYNDWKTVCTVVKESKQKYRFSMSSAIALHSDSLFSKFYKQKYCFVNTFL